MTTHQGRELTTKEKNTLTEPYNKRDGWQILLLVSQKPVELTDCVELHKVSNSNRAIQQQPIIKSELTS